MRVFDVTRAWRRLMSVQISVQYNHLVVAFLIFALGVLCASGTLLQETRSLIDEHWEVREQWRRELRSTKNECSEALAECKRCRFKIAPDHE